MEGGETLSGTGSGVRFVTGGGLPPPSHEELLVGPDGIAWYVTGMPWPGQAPFDEIGAYRADVGGAVFERLAGEARAVLASAPTVTGDADLGIEGVSVDSVGAHWSPDARPAAGADLLRGVRAVITTTREEPWAVVRGRIRDAGTVELTNRGDHPLTLGAGEIRAGWGMAGDPPTPLDLAPRPPGPIALPDAVNPGATLTFALPDAGPRPTDPGHDHIHVLVHLAFRSPVDEGWIDGWLVAGPG